MTIYLIEDQPVIVWTGEVALDGLMAIPRGAASIILIAGLGGMTSQPGYRALASRLQDAELATLLVDLLTGEEQQFDSRTGHFRVDMQLLSKRVRQVARWVEKSEETRELPLAFFGTSIAGSAGLAACAAGAPFHSLVLNRPRIDLAGEAARRVEVPVLLIQDAERFSVRALRTDEEMLGAPHRLDIVPGAADIMHDAVVAEAVARHAIGWYRVNAPQLVA